MMMTTTTMMMMTMMMMMMVMMLMMMATKVAMMSIIVKGFFGVCSGGFGSSGRLLELFSGISTPFWSVPKRSKK